MLDFQQRVVDEYLQLEEKLHKLTLFFDTDIFSRLDDEEKIRMRKQADIMKQYYLVLQDRIDAFK